MKNIVRSLALGAATVLAFTGCASGQQAATGDYPSRDIRLVVPWAAGGSGDLTARSLAPLLEADLGASIIVENRPGANGSVGYNWLKDQDPDGYSLAVMGVEVAILQFQNYDVDPADFIPIGQASSGPGAIAVPVDSPYLSLQDLIDDAKANPGDVTFSSPGVGSVWDSTVQGFKELAGIELKNVPYDGSAPAVAAAAAGDVDFSTDGIGNQKIQVDAGKLRYLAMLTDERDPNNPDVPTAKEQGVDLQNASWIGVMVPAGTPDDVVQKLSSALKTAVTDPAYIKIMEAANQLPFQRDSAEMATFIDEEATRYGPWIELAQRD
ncbi:Bug family tripartite tricarboxylate transporter substrate binding protein [Cryobacterium aureum]|uniref:Bug family tripartite tricarboxylate transporter substrate binding protein n=1 Tax=Cryobacterium aureum TaxID=995037 RepID=UPI000CF5568E|nr:tripartite tricarboxylate transporter substrate binding protein [Cryobacterium aureum]